MVPENSLTSICLYSNYLSAYSAILIHSLSVLPVYDSIFKSFQSCLSDETLYHQRSFYQNSLYRSIRLFHLPGHRLSTHRFCYQGNFQTSFNLSAGL